MKRAGILVLLGATLAIFSLPGRAALINYTFTGVDEAIIGTQSLGIEATETNIFSITNNSAVAWTDFHLTTNLTATDGSAMGGFSFGTYSGPTGSTLAIDFVTDLVTVSEWEGLGTLNILDLSIGIGEVLQFSVEAFCGVPACDGFDIAYSAFPTFVDSLPDPGGVPTAVPEPPLIVLFGIGMGFLALTARRRKPV